MSAVSSTISKFFYSCKNINCVINSNKATFVIKSVKLNFIQKRYMKRVAPFVSSSVAPQRAYASTHSGWFAGDPVRFRAANTNKHQIVAVRSCDKAGCLGTDCTQPNTVCDLSEHEARNAVVPFNAAHNNYEDNAVGNFTHRVPKDKKGVQVDPARDYSGNMKSQFMVVEPSTPRINLNTDVVVDPGATEYVQEPSHSSAILDTPFYGGETLRDRLNNK